MKKRYFLMLVVGVLLITVSACAKSGGKASNSGKDKWSDIEKNKKVVIGLDDTFVPMGFRDESDNIVGFDIDLAKEVFKEYGIEPEFQSIDWSMKENELNNGTIDLIWNGYNITDERKEKVAFSEPYINSRQQLVVMKDSNISSYKDMKGKVLGAQNASTGQDLIDKNPAVFTDIIADNEPVLFDTFNEAFIDLKAKRIDGLIVDNVYANYYIAQQKNSEDYQIIDTPFESAEFAVGIRKSDKELKTKIDDALKKLKESGKTKEISEKWFGNDQTIK
ncbi:amino acid ABC transporter substrate-binding protein [Vagococcus sp. JNUCC 83]